MRIRRTMINIRKNKTITKSEALTDTLSDKSMVLLKQQAHGVFLKYLHEEWIQEYTGIDKLYGTDSVDSLRYIVRQYNMMTECKSGDETPSKGILTAEPALARYLNELGNLALIFSKIEDFKEVSKLHSTINDFLGAVAFDTMILNTFYNRDYPESLADFYSRRDIKYKRGNTL